MQRILILLFTLVTLLGHAQQKQPTERRHLQLKRISLAYRWFEADAFGDNPLTIGRLLKDPGAYQNYVSTIDWNDLHGSPGIAELNEFFANAEWQKTGTNARFWRHTTFEAGVFITPTSKRSGISIGTQNWNEEDSSIHRGYYTVAQSLQFAGASIGLNRYVPILKKLSFVTGLHVQGALAVHHVFAQQWDSSVFHSPTATWHNSTTTYGPDLKAKHYFQWQVFVPLGFEVDLYRQRLFLRAELDAGIIGGRMQSAYHVNREANALGGAIIYQLR